MTLVIDASVFAKLFLNEQDSSVARNFCKWAIESDKTLLAPHLLKQELCLSALAYEVSFEIPLALLDGYLSNGLRLIDPPKETWLLAEKISRTGNPKSGFPSLQDSLYHALAIEACGTFVTADKRHLAKTGKFGHALALTDWETLLDS